MNGHTSPDVEGVNLFEAKGFVEGIADLVEEAHYNHLERSHSADAASEGDEHRGRGIESRGEADFVDVNVESFCFEAGDEDPLPKGAQ